MPPANCAGSPRRHATSDQSRWPRRPAGGCSGCTYRDPSRPYSVVPCPRFRGRCHWRIPPCLSSSMLTPSTSGAKIGPTRIAPRGVCWSRARGRRRRRVRLLLHSWNQRVGFDKRDLGAVLRDTARRRSGVGTDFSNRSPTRIVLPPKPSSRDSQTRSARLEQRRPSVCCIPRST